MSRPPKKKPAPARPYPEGFDGILEQMEGRRAPVVFDEGQTLAPLDIDLAPLKSQTVTSERSGNNPSTFGWKSRHLREEFLGEPELCLLNAQLIALLRKRDQPAQTAPLFLRLWAEESDFLIEHLNQRWLVSSLTTFGDHGETELQRRVGLSLTVLFSTMKLYETERLYSGRKPERPFRLDQKINAPLPLKMDPYSIKDGGLDVNILGRLWQDASEDKTLAPLAQHLLNLLINQDKGLFFRLAQMRKRTEVLAERAAARSAATKAPPSVKGAVPAPVPAPKSTSMTPPTWGIVATVKAPLLDIARFAAYHLQLGATRLTLYLDAPSAPALAYLNSVSAIEAIGCDDAYWAAQSKPRMPAHQLRQTHNANAAYARANVDWIAHIDVDEFLLPDNSISGELNALKAKSAGLLVPPIEQLASVDPKDQTQYFKTTARQAGQDKSVLSEIYPTYGAHLRGGYISHLEGKIFARTGIKGAWLGIHALRLGGKPVSNVEIATTLRLGHAHAPSWVHFQKMLGYRLTHGSYRKHDEKRFRLSDVLDFLSESEGEAGLRHFYSEVCEARPELLLALENKGMLVARKLELDTKVKDIFGALPTGSTA